MGDDDRYTSKLIVLQSWRRLLATSREIAQAKADASIRLARDSGLFHHTELARFYAQMMNGTAAPEDFTGGLVCAHSVASG